LTQNNGCLIYGSYANLEGETIIYVNAYLGLGSNIEPRVEYINQAIREIEEIQGIEITGRSSLYLTSPWGKMNQDDFINMVLRIRTALPALTLLHHLKNIEIKMGRHQNERWGPRIIDLDILLYGDETISDQALTVPHPHMRQRLFVLLPLAEIDAEVVFPDDGAKVQEVLTRVLEREGYDGIEKIEGSPAATPVK